MFCNEGQESIQLRTPSNDRAGVVSVKASNKRAPIYVTKVTLVVAAVALASTCIYVFVQSIHSEQASSKQQPADNYNDGVVHVTTPQSLQTDTMKSSPSDLQVYTSVNIWQSAADTTDRITQKPDATFGPDFQFEGPTIQVSSVTGQTIEGFGGAFTEASALVYKKMTSQQQQQFIEDYFGQEGLGYVLGRTHINSCDFSTGNYAFDDTDGDIQLSNFDTALNRDQQALIPLIKAAKNKLDEQQKKLKLLATPWSPPAWMKTNGMMDHSDRPCIKDGLQDVWARYMSKWISSYEATGINIWAITIQNEPENNASWEACMMTAEEEATFLSQFLGPELRTSHPEIKIYVFDHNKDHVYDWANTILSDEKAKQYVSGVAYHWYSGDSFDNLQKIRAAFPETSLLATEATWEAWRWKPGTTLATGDWSFGEGYAHDMIGDFNSGSTGWIDWNLVLDEVGGPNHVNNVCDSAIQMNTTIGEVYKHPQYYYIGHFSRFVLPGSVQLATSVLNSKTYSGPTRQYGTCTDDDGLQTAAFRRPDGRIVLVALNCGSLPIDFKLSVADQAVKLSLPSHSIQTYLF